MAAADWLHGITIREGRRTRQKHHALNHLFMMMDLSRSAEFWCNILFCLLHMGDLVVMASIANKWKACHGEAWHQLTN
jgi:hypothetical protein